MSVLLDTILLQIMLCSTRRFSIMTWLGCLVPCISIELRFGCGAAVKRYLSSWMRVIHDAQIDVGLDAPVRRRIVKPASGSSDCYVLAIDVVKVSHLLTQGYSVCMLACG